MFGYKLTLFSPHYVPDDQKKMFDEVYQTWKTTFKEVVESAGGKLDPDDFFRCDVVPVITAPDGRIVATATMTLFDVELKAVQEHHYIRVLTPETRLKLHSDNINRIFSCEYLNVLPDFRKTAADVSWLEVLACVCMNVMKESIADAGMGMPRIDRKVDQACYGVGGIRMQEPFSKMNYPCDILLFPRRKEQPTVFSGSLPIVNALWKTRTVVGASTEVNRFIKVA